MATGSTSYKEYYFFHLLFFVNDNIKPIKIAQESMDDPPYEIKGKVIPLVGKRFKLEDTFIRVWKIKIFERPINAEKLKKFFSLIDIK